MDSKDSLLNEAKDDLEEVVEWINVEMNNPHQVPMRPDDWNWILARVKAARTIIYNELKRKAE